MMINTGLVFTCWIQRKLTDNHNKPHYVKVQQHDKNFIKGYTLVELSIVLSILGLILVLVSQILSFQLNNVRVEEDRVTYRQQAREAILFIDEMFQTAREIDQSTVLTIKEDKLVYPFPYENHVVLDVRDPASSNSDAWLDRGDLFGELKDRDGNVRATYIQEIEVSDIDDYSLKIEVATGRNPNDTLETVDRIIKKMGR